MRKKGVLLSTLILGLALTACGDIRNLNDLKEAIGLTSDSSGGDAAQEESTDAESLPASQEYVSSDGSYQVIMLEGFTQTEAPVLAGSDVMMLENDSDRKGFGAFCVKTPKSNVSGNPGSMESLSSIHPESSPSENSGKKFISTITRLFSDSISAIFPDN